LRPSTGRGNHIKSLHTIQQLASLRSIDTGEGAEIKGYVGDGRRYIIIAEGIIPSGGTSILVIADRVECQIALCVQKSSNTYEDKGK
jgi:hypothetical protein